MGETNGEVRFHTESLFTGDTGVIDGCTIRGVSVITGGQEAEGHGLTIDDETLRQLQACAKERGKIPVTLDHGSGIKDINGFLTGFRLDSTGGKPKIRADWHLLESHPETKVMIEKAEKMPTCFGLSVAFKGPPKGVAIGGGKMAARCEKLLSVDVVTRPAANEGLFSVPSVDKSLKSMAKEKEVVKPTEGEQPAPEPTLAEVLQAVQQLNGRLDQHEQILGELQGGDQPSLEEIAQMNDQELAELGLTRAEVDAAVQEVLAGMEAEGEGGPQGEGEVPAGAGAQGEGAGEPAMAGAGTGTAAGATSGAAAFHALQQQVVKLESKLKLTELRKKQESEEVELSAIEQKILILAEQRDAAIKFAEEKEAENEALRLAVRTGTRPVRAGVDNEVRMFGVGENGELHQFQVRVKQLVDGGKSQGEAITFAQKENPSLHADWVQSQRGRKVA
jgi:uncharacterized protein YjiS (DUF1127 family)